jgi:hypothetical protein
LMELPEGQILNRRFFQLFEKSKLTLYLRQNLQYN